MRKPYTIDRTGMRHGRLVAQWPVGYKHKAIAWLCLCDCGRLTIPSYSSVLSCGCLERERRANLAASQTTHGHSAGRFSPEYIAWMGMKRRCSTSDPEIYKYYKARGITVCDKWRNSFPAFLADMGQKPDPSFSLDRIDNDGNYEPGNCRWATVAQQNENRRPVGRSASGRYQEVADVADLE